MDGDPDLYEDHAVLGPPGLQTTVARAQVLERPLGMRLTGLIHEVARRSRVATWAAWLYTLFMVGALAPVLGPAAPWVRVVGVGLDIAFITGIWLYHGLTSAEFEPAAS